MSVNRSSGNFTRSIRNLLLKEIDELRRNPLEGICLMGCNEQDFSKLDFLIEGPQDTPFQGGRFHVKFVLDDQFPTTPPKAYFVTKIFHPNVGSNGAICINYLKDDWQPEMTLQRVLIAIKCLLVDPNPESALNAEAAKMLLEDYHEYFQTGRMMTEIHALRGAENVPELVGNPVASSADSEPEKVREKTGLSKGDRKTSKLKKHLLRRL